MEANPSPMLLMRARAAAAAMGRRGVLPVACRPAPAPLVSRWASTAPAKAPASPALAPPLPEADSIAPLRADVRTLGRVFGEWVRDRAGADTLETIERIRGLSKRWRNKGDEGAFQQLLGVVDKMSPTEALTVARAFSHFLSLANAAEQHHRARRARYHAFEAAEAARESRPDPTRQPGQIEHALQDLIARGHGPDAIFAQLLQQKVELVLTAHPTEVNRRTLLLKHARVVSLLEENDRLDVTPAERAQIHAALKREIAAIWETDEIRRERPTPQARRRLCLGCLCFCGRRRFSASAHPPPPPLCPCLSRSSLSLLLRAGRGARGLLRGGGHAVGRRAAVPAEP